MWRRSCLTGLVVLASVGAVAVADCTRAVGIELQRYPVGTTGSLVYRHPLGERSVMWFGVGYNDADREDEGEFDDEQASGAGLSAGYRRYLESDRIGWSFGGRLDLWDLEVDWIDQLGTPGQTRGTTDTLVLQPTGVAAHGWGLGRSAWVVEVSVALGAEINTRTDGPDVGEGAILLGGVSLLKRF